MRGKNGKMGAMAVIAGLDAQNWRREAAAGITMAAAAIPVAIAVAAFAGLPPQAGLYALIVPAILFALAARSGAVTAAPDAVAAGVIAASIAPLAHGDATLYGRLAAAQALVAAAVLGGVALFRLHFVAAALARPALLGVVGAVALDLALRQLGGMLGLPAHWSATPVLWSDAADFIARLGSASLWAAALAIAALAILLIVRRISRALPAELVVLACGIAGFAVFGISQHGVPRLGDAAPLADGAPLFSWPLLAGSQWAAIIPGAIFLALLALSGSALQDRRRDEAVAFALSDLAAGFTGAFAVGASDIRSRRLRDSGAVSQLPGLVAALLVLAVVLFGTPLLDAVPVPIAATIVFLAVLPSLRVRELRRLWRLSVPEFMLAAACFLATVAFGPLIGVAVALALSLLGMLRRAAAPPVDLVDVEGRPRASLREKATGRTYSAPGIVIVRFAGQVYSANAPLFERSIRKAVGDALPRGLAHLVLDCEAITALDTTAASVMADTFAWVRAQGVTVDFSRARAVLRVELERYGLLGSSRLFESNAEAVAELG